MNKKGQLSIELVILLAVFLLFFQAMILPSVEFSENVLKDTQSIIVAKKSVDNLAMNIEQLEAQDGYGKREVYFYLPSNTIMDCNNISKAIHYDITVSKQQPLPKGCNTLGVCSLNRAMNINTNFDCNTIGPGHTGTIKIQKDVNGDITILSDTTIN